jgi:hypothetical protein
MIYLDHFSDEMAWARLSAVQSGEEWIPDLEKFLLKQFPEVRIIFFYVAANALFLVQSELWQLPGTSAEYFKILTPTCLWRFLDHN